MKVSPFVSGVATGAVAGAVMSLVAAGAMLNPSLRHSAEHAANRAEHAVHRAVGKIGQEHRKTGIRKRLPYIRKPFICFTSAYAAVQEITPQPLRKRRRYGRTR